MVKTGSRILATLVALLLALLFLLPPPQVLAAETAPSLGEEISSPGEEPSDTSSGVDRVPVEEPSSSSGSLPEESVPAEGEPPTESSQAESSSEDPVSSQPEEPESASSQEEGEPPEEGASSREETEEDTYAAYPLLVTGGHDAYMSGETGARFYPERAMTRKEMAAVLYNLLAAKPPVTESLFSDVSSGDWYYTAVNALAEAGVLSGYDDGTFLPDREVTRAEFVTALAKCFELRSGDSRFSDTVGHWAEEYINSAVALDWISGYGDGTFQPNSSISRCEVTPVLNKALGRTGDGFAADAAAVQEFVDVAENHWAFEHIAEAADPVGNATGWITGSTVNLRAGPSTSTEAIGSLNRNDAVTVLTIYLTGWTQVTTSGGSTGYVSSQYVTFDNPNANEPDPEPTEITVGSTVRVTGEGLRLRSEPNTTSEVITTFSIGVLLTVTSVESNGWYGVQTARGTTGYVSGEYVALYGGSGSASGATLSASVATLAQYQTFRLDGSVTSGMDAMTWTSSNENVAVVGYTVSYSGSKVGAMVYGMAPGTATITFSDRAGTTRATCTVTVTAAEPVRFAYAEENIATANTSFNLIGITDSNRTVVRFEVVGGSPYETTTYTAESRNSSYGLPDNIVRVFSCPVTFQTAGEYTVRAYARSSEGWSSEYCEFTVLVVSGDIDSSAATAESRRVSSEGLDIISNFEGSVPEIRDDVLASGNPTVGYGYVVPVNTAFYNNLTTSELFAQLVQIANETYSAAVEQFRANNGIRMNQAQFDALTSFVFNCGVGTLTTSFGVCRALLNAVDPSSISSENTAFGTLNVIGTSVYSSASVDSEVVTGLSRGTNVTVFGYQAYRTSTQQEVWYHVSLPSGQVGWIPAGYVQLSGTWTHDFSWADSTSLANNFLQWNKAGGVVEGLVLRRLAECKIFFFGNYAEAYHSNSNYRYNTYGFIFPSNCSQYDYRR